MKTVAIVQSRLGSQRLPRKAFAQIDGRPMIEHVLERVAAVAALDEVVLATTRLSEDDDLASYAALFKVPVFRGSDQDVLRRFYRCAVAFEADVILRVTGDCPLWDSYSGALVVQTLLDSNADYVHNIDEGTDGWDAEAFTFRALRQANQWVSSDYDCEHVTPLLRNSGLFDVERIVPRRIPNNEKWSVDTEEDLARVRTVFAEREAA